MRKFNNKIIGLTGVARSGKDSTFNILHEYFTCYRIAFADELKKAVDPLTKQLLNISAFTTDDNEKKIIRPILVTVGQAAREQNHRVWIEKVDSIVKQTLIKNQTCVITDVRFSTKPKDEADYIQKELGGILINIDRILDNGELLGPANETEAQQYPIIKARADIHITARNLDCLHKEVYSKILPLLV